MKKLLLLLLLFVGIGVSSAQETQTEEAISLDERVEKLEKRSQVWDKIKPAFQLSGYLQAGYDYLWDEEGTKTSSLHLRRARMTLKGDIYKGEKGATASYRLQVDLCKSPVILDLWAKFQPVNQFSVQFGQFKVPISIENTDYAATRLEFISYANTVQRMSRNGGGDMTGINSSGPDNNKSKDVAARLTIQPLQKLKIAAYYLIGETNITSLLSKYPTIGDSWSNHSYVAYNRYGGGVDYSNDFLFARTEYIAGKTGDYLSSGIYAQIGYKLRDKFSVGLRYDYFDQNLNASAPCQTSYTVALSYYPWKHLRLQAEYTLQKFNAVAQTPNTNCLYFMATALF